MLVDGWRYIRGMTRLSVLAGFYDAMAEACFPDPNDSLAVREVKARFAQLAERQLALPHLPEPSLNGQVPAQVPSGEPRRGPGRPRREDTAPREEGSQ